MFDSKIPRSNRTKTRTHYLFHSTLSASMIKSTYGVNIAEEDDKYVATAEAGSSTNELLIDGATVLEFFPLRVLHYIPQWFPGLDILRRVKKGREAVDKARLVPWAHGKALVVSFYSIVSMHSSLLMLDCSLCGSDGRRSSA